VPGLGSIPGLGYLFGVTQDQTTREEVIILLTVHIHLLADIVGGGAADGYAWPIPYLRPFSAAWNVEWSGQWALSSWQNNVVTFALMGVMLYLAWRKGYSPLGLVSPRSDRVFVDVLRARFGAPGG